MEISEKNTSNEILSMQDTLSDDALLAKLGYKSEFRREFSVRSSQYFSRDSRIKHGEARRDGVVCRQYHGRHRLCFIHAVIWSSLRYVCYSTRYTLILKLEKRWARGNGMGVVHTLSVRHDGCSIYCRANIFYAVCPCVSTPPSVAYSFSDRTSAGLYYFAAKMAPERYAPLASWFTGWANITGQVTLVCSIDFTW